MRKAGKIGLVHNEDDIILAPGQIDFFKSTFGARAKIYPMGGHCGNMKHHQVVEHIVGFFGN